MPLIQPTIRTLTSSIDNSDKINSSSSNSKKTEQSNPPIPQPRSLFDIDNATSAKLADKLQQEAKKCDLNVLSEGDSSETSPSETLNQFGETLPPSPIHTIFGERRPSWRLKTDFNNKVNSATCWILLSGVFSVLCLCILLLYWFFFEWKIPISTCYILI